MEVKTTSIAHHKRRNEMGIMTEKQHWRANGLIKAVKQQILSCNEEELTVLLDELDKFLERKPCWVPKPKKEHG